MYMECLNDINYVAIVMDLRISCQYSTFIDTASMRVYLGSFECHVVVGIQPEVSTTTTWNSNY